MKLRLKEEKSRTKQNKARSKRPGNAGNSEKAIPGFSFFRRITGLTFSEWRRLKNLKKRLKDGEPGSRIPDSTQKTITFLCNRKSSKPLGFTAFVDCYSVVELLF